MTPSTTPVPVEASEWKLVPVEPTAAMLRAAYEPTRAYASGEAMGQTLDETNQQIWSAMLAAAPQPVQGIDYLAACDAIAANPTSTPTVQGIEAEELADDIAWLKRMGSDGVAPNLFGQGYSVCQKRIARLLSRLTPIIAGERETKAKNPLLPFAEHMLKNLRHFRQNTSGNQADAYYTFIKGEDEFWRNLENTVLALATQSPDLAGKGGAG